VVREDHSGSKLGGRRQDEKVGNQKGGEQVERGTSIRWTGRGMHTRVWRFKIGKVLLRRGGTVK